MGLDAKTAEVAGRISLGIFFAETNGNQNIGNARSNKYKGIFKPEYLRIKMDEKSGL